MDRIPHSRVEYLYIVSKMDRISSQQLMFRLLRQLVTGGASFELEKSLAEGAGLRGGYSTPDTLVSIIQRNILIGDEEESKSLVRGRR